MNGKRIIIAGGTGFIGRAIAGELVARGADVVILTRTPDPSPLAGRHVRWDGKTIGDWAGEVDGADAVINVAGKNVNCRYTPKALAEVDESRVNAVTVMNTVIARCAAPPPVLIQAATTAIYGDTGDRWLDEDAPLGEGVAPRTAIQWEDAFAAHATPRTRRVLLRISFVLGRGGGALSMLSALTKFGLGGTVGTGRQYISWIHVDDLVRLVMRAIDDASMSGTYNVATPNPVPNAEFMKELRRVHRRPWSPPAPAPLVHIGCFLMRTEPVLALTGRRVLPKRLTEMGFAFHYPDLRPALENVVSPPSPQVKVISPEHEVIEVPASGPFKPPGSLRGALIWFATLAAVLGVTLGQGMRLSMTSWFIFGPILAFVILGSIGVLSGAIASRSAVTFTVTPLKLEVLIASPGGKGARRYVWQRDEVLEVRVVRPTGTEGQLQVRQKHGPPAPLLPDRDDREITRVAAAVTDALARIPPRTFGEHAAPGGGVVLGYGREGRPWEIEIRRFPDGLTIIIPRRPYARSIGFLPLLVPAVALAAGTMIAVHRLPDPDLRRNIAFGVALLTTIVAARVAVHWSHRHEPFVLTLGPRRLRVDDPGRLWRVRSYARADVADAETIALTHRKSGHVLHHAQVRLLHDTIEFCRGRDEVDVRRVVAALREALGLAPEDVA